MPISFQLDDDLLKALAQKCPTMALNLAMREGYVSNKPVVSDKPKPVARDPLTLSADQRARVLRYAKRRGVSPQMMLSMCLDVGLDLFSLPPMYSASDK